MGHLKLHLGHSELGSGYSKLRIARWEFTPARCPAASPAGNSKSEIQKSQTRDHRPFHTCSPFQQMVTLRCRFVRRLQRFRGFRMTQSAKSVDTLCGTPNPGLGSAAKRAGRQRECATTILTRPTRDAMIMAVGEGDVHVGSIIG